MLGDKRRASGSSGISPRHSGHSLLTSAPQTPTVRKHSPKRVSFGSHEVRYIPSANKQRKAPRIHDERGMDVTPEAPTSEIATTSCGSGNDLLVTRDLPLSGELHNADIAESCEIPAISMCQQEEKDLHAKEIITLIRSHSVYI